MPFGTDGASDDDASTGDSNSGGSDEGDASTVEFSCTDITNEYDTRDVGERPVLVDFDYPALFDEFEYLEASGGAIFETEADLTEGSISMSLMQAVDPESDPSGAPESESGGAVTTFNGEEVQFAGFSDNSTLLWGGDLPYQVDGERQLFATVISMDVQQVDSIECGDAMREAAEHIVESFELNDETTLGG